MISVDSVVGFRLAAVQAQRQYAVAARLLRVAAETGARQETFAALQAAAQGASDALTKAVADLAAGLNVYA